MSFPHIILHNFLAQKHGGMKAMLARLLSPCQINMCDKRNNLLVVGESGVK